MDSRTLAGSTGGSVKSHAEIPALLVPPCDAEEDFRFHSIPRACSLLAWGHSKAASCCRPVREGWIARVREHRVGSWCQQLSSALPGPSAEERGMCSCLRGECHPQEERGAQLAPHGFPRGCCGLQGADGSDHERGKGLCSPGWSAPCRPCLEPPRAPLSPTRIP